MTKQRIWIVYGDYDFNGGFSEIFHSQSEAHARVAELLEIDCFDGRFDNTAAGEAYENGKWKCLECDCHEIASTDVDLLDALQKAENVLRWAIQEAKGKVRSEVVGGWNHHADEMRRAINKALPRLSDAQRARMKAAIHNELSK